MVERSNDFFGSTLHLAKYVGLVCGSVMTKLARIQDAIRALPPSEQDILRVWMDEASLDLEEDSPKLAAQLLKAVRGPHRALRKAELDSIAARVLQEQRKRRTA